MFRKIFLVASLMGLIALLWPILSQDKPKSSSALELAIEAKEYARADSILQKEVSTFRAVNNFDTLISYIPFAGKIANARYGVEKASVAVFGSIDSINARKASPAILVKAYRVAADFFSTIGQNKEGYKASEEALANTLIQSGVPEEEIAKCEYSLGIYAHRLGNVSLALSHHRKAMAIRDKNKNTDPEQIYLSANAMASLMWYASKYDSATLLYNKALDAVGKMPVNDINKYFRPGNIQNNLAALYNSEGKTTEAIAAMQSTISNFQHFIAGKEEGAKRESAIEGLFEAIDNLAGIYKELGDYGKAGQLLLYSYQQKQKKLDPAQPGIFISEILLGQYYQAIREDEISLEYLEKGLAKLEKTEGDYLFWAADAYHTLAMIYEDKKDAKKAAEYYEKSESLYEESYQGEYDNVYMDFLRNASVFYATNGDYTKAFQRADKVYQYLVKVGESNNVQGFNQLLNIAEINYLTKRYPEAISYSNKALGVINVKIKEGTNLLDSLKMDAFKPKAILIQTKSEYQLQPKKDSAFLSGLSRKLTNALEILEKKKVLIDDAASINILIADHQELIDFAKKIELQLAGLTGNSMHLDRFINLHESALYTRIRSRLDIQDAMQFSRLPDSIQRREHELKKAIPSALQVDKPNSELMNNYMAALSRWDAHLEQVKKEYPAYYEMRYGTIFKSLPELQSTLPDSTTVIRYFFVDSSLIALVADKKDKKIITLEYDGLDKKINSLVLNGSTEKEILPVLHQLYTSIWQPLESSIKHNKITIIPDGILYYLNFDMLSPQPLHSYKDFASKSLLSKHIFSYHYSLFMLGRPSIESSANENYVAFAPGFSDDVKQKYLSESNDSVNLDYKYLQLLPQPATNRLTKKIKKSIGGDIFLEEASTRSSFRENAGGHKIIHIGTHAEFNNINPEHSGLIFAKNTSAIDSNFLSLPDIYNCNMLSDLTILTACESGRPGYQDGEGMVSLAHAFNYAGSQRILMALWRIDEQSSAQITDLFIQNLKKGQQTDEALQQAKLKYLEQADGRMLAPAHWAGLVMMGEPVKLTLGNPNKLTYLWIAGGILLLGIFWWVVKNKQSQKIKPGLRKV